MNEPAPRLREIRKDLETLDRPIELTAEEFLTLPASLQKILWWIILERAVTIARLADFLNEPEDAAKALVKDLDTGGLIEQVPACGFPVYRVCLVPRRLRPPEELARAMGIVPSGMHRC
jgi:hypothetical protein